MDIFIPNDSHRFRFLTIEDTAINRNLKNKYSINWPVLNLEYKLSSSKYIIDRDAVTVLDFIGDIGGF